MGNLKYRLALDLGTNSIGWAMLRLNADNRPNAVIKAGVRIFSDGRNPKDGASLAKARRDARAMRRRRDRLLKRKRRMMDALVELGFFPSDMAERKIWEVENPYALRARGLDEALHPYEFGRAIFHLNQRRGFKSNRKTDAKDSESGALKQAIKASREALKEQNCRTIGEWLHKRMEQGSTVRARYREQRLLIDGRTKIDKSYDLYIDRAMVEDEFDQLWQAQAERNPKVYHPEAGLRLKDILLFQRKLRPVKPGRCTFLPEEERAAAALPISQRFRIYQEVNNLRLLTFGLNETPLTLEQRDLLVDALERSARVTFDRMRRILKLDGLTQFNLEDAVTRKELKGNLTSVILSRKELFGNEWFSFDPMRQDEIVHKLLDEENENKLVQWLMENTGVDLVRAEAISAAGLPEGTVALSEKALASIVPALQADVITYDKAVVAVGFEHHSQLSAQGDLQTLPYYGISLQRYVGFGTNEPNDPEEKRYGRIANPTVHIGLNQVRLIVNSLIRKYGRPQEIVVEVTRELKLNKDRKDEIKKEQQANQNRNRRIRETIAQMRNIVPDLVRRDDVEKWILWEELSPNAADRKCPYSGKQISASMLLSDEVEVEHILPFSRTLDDSRNNKTVSLRAANRIKGNQTPWEAFGKQKVSGYDYEDIIARAEQMSKPKRQRFAEDAMERWLNEEKDFLARALNDTAYLSRITKAYLEPVCDDIWVIPGRLTGMLRRQLGLNDILSRQGEKNRDDHRHHAVDACVIGITDRGLLQRFATASGRAREDQVGRLVEEMPDPWGTYREHVRRAVNNVWVSHRPDHGYEGAMHNDTAYGLLPEGRVYHHKWQEGKRIRTEEKLSVIPMSDGSQLERHGRLPDGSPKPYKGYKGDSNYCMEIVRDDKGNWKGEVVSTFQAYQIAKEFGPQRLRDRKFAISGKPLVMRLMRGDLVRIETNGVVETLRIAQLKTKGEIIMAPIHEANVDARVRSKEFSYINKSPGSLGRSKGRSITISPTGELHDPGFRG